MKTTVALSPLNPRVPKAPEPTEHGWGWHAIDPIVMKKRGIKIPRAKCICRKTATAQSANHTTPQELWFACRHCCHTFYRTNPSEQRL